MKRLYPQAPVASVGAIIIRHDKILLVKRGRQPSKGLWSIPGGAIELGESARNALKREVKEECGIDIRVGPIFDIVDKVTRDRKGRIVYHYIIIDFIAKYVKGSLKAATDITDVSWFSPREMAKLAMPARTRQVVLKVLKNRECP
jgi:ADP-ribose pyrophosphatase YjhB (NUDIX family)